MVREDTNHGCGGIVKRCKTIALLHSAQAK